MSRTKYPTLDPQFLIKMLGSCKDAKERGLIRVLYMTGMHVSSLRNVKIIRVGSGRKLEWTRPKTNKTLSSHLIPKEWFADIETFMAKRKVTRQHYLRVVKEIGSRAGYDGISPMTFRHDRCVRLLQLHNNNLVVVAQLMGCSVGIVARNYGLMNPETFEVMEDLTDEQT